MASFEEDIYLRAHICRDEFSEVPGMAWESIASLLWQGFVECPEQWPSTKGAIADKATFYRCVKTSVQDYDREMEW